MLHYAVMSFSCSTFFRRRLLKRAVKYIVRAVILLTIIFFAERFRPLHTFCDAFLKDSQNVSTDDDRIKISPDDKQMTVGF